MVPACPPAFFDKENAMSKSYNKLVPEIIQSSIWNESAEVRIVWVTFLAIKDEDGYVRGDAKTLARLANVDILHVSEALALFQAEDNSSHTPDNDGRRIEPAPGGWIVLNHQIYREIGMSSSNKDYWRNKKREQRERDKSKKKGEVKDKSMTVKTLSASASASVSASSIEGESEGSDPVWDTIANTVPPTGMNREGWIKLKQMHPRADHKKVMEESVMLWLNNGIKSSFIGYMKRMMSVSETDKGASSGKTVEHSQADWDKSISRIHSRLKQAYKAEICNEQDGAVSKVITALEDEYVEYPGIVGLGTSFAVDQGWPDGKGLK